MALPKSNKKEQRSIPDPATWMAQHMGMTVNGPQGAAPDTAQQGGPPMTPGQSGSAAGSGPTTSSGAPQGFGGIPKKKAPQGNQGQQTTKSGPVGLHPNNKSKAKPRNKGKLPSNLPARNAMVRRVHPGFGGAVPSHNQPARSGLLSKFEGFTPSPH